MTVNQITPGAMLLSANIFLKEIYYNEEIKKNMDHLLFCIKQCLYKTTYTH